MLLTDLFTQIADAIREKDGTEEKIAAGEKVKVERIEGVKLIVAPVEE